MKHLKKTYRKDGKEISVLKDLSLEVSKGEMVAIMGVSGSGKTTLLNTIAGLAKADEGDIILNNSKLKTMSRSELAKFRRNTIGIIFQDFNLIDSLNIRENILLPMTLEHVPLEEQEERLHTVLEVLEIEELADKGVGEISGGQKQRVAIARALVNQPELILADEPTGNLDRQSAKEVMHYLKELNHKFGTSLLVVTHDIFTAGCCDRVVILENGQFCNEIVKEEEQQDFQRDIMQKFSTVVMGGKAYDQL